MIAKIPGLLVFILIAYLLPLIGSFHLIWRQDFIFLLLVCIVLFISQPPVSIKESRNFNTRDKNSIWIILGTAVAIQCFMMVEWIYVNGAVTAAWSWFKCFALFLIIFGTVLRIRAVITLGKFFTATVRSQKGQRIISKGVYQWIRHPSYTGAFLVIIGSALWMGSYLTSSIGFFLMLMAYTYRINYEETMLLDEYGEEYAQYRLRTKKLIPFLY